VAAANPDVASAIASGIVAPNATNLVLLFALDRIPVSTQRLVCHWHCDAHGRLFCAWEPNISADPASSIRKNLSKRFMSQNGSNIGSA
jgi:hypothetical protein